MYRIGYTYHISYSDTTSRSTYYVSLPLAREWPSFELCYCFFSFKARVTWYYQQYYWQIPQKLKLYIFIALNFYEYYDFFFILSEIYEKYATDLKNVKEVKTYSKLLLAFTLYLYVIDMNKNSKQIQERTTKNWVLVRG